MSLVLQVVGPLSGQLGAAASKTFEGSGGSIGRLADNQWVIPSEYVSSRHGRIHFRDGAYFLEDTSSNGIFFGSRTNRLVKGQLQRLAAGDRFYIDEFEIAVSVNSAAPLAAPVGGSILGDIFGSDEPLQAAGVLSSTAETDPLKALGLSPAPRPVSVPRLEDMDGAPPWRDRAPVIEVKAQPPAPPPLQTPASPTDSRIPDDFDPFGVQPRPGPVAPPAAVAERRAEIPTAIPAETPRRETPVRASPPAEIPRPRVSAPPREAEPAPGSVPPPRRPEPVVEKPAPIPESLTSQSGRLPQLDLIALLEAAGVPTSAATPGMARELGQILRIVVGGVMEVLAARERIKDEFRIRHTTFKATDNNPLKFSANVEDALYNLLVKRNPAYLGPVDAFEDGFADIRHHQMAMLAGMRLAYEAMLRRFDPARMQERFDEKGTRGALLPLPARMRYWDQFSEEYREQVKDPEAGFRDLFGAEFTRAYEEQLVRLRTLSRSQKRGS